MTLIVPAVLGGVALSVMALVSLAASRRRRSQPAQARVDVPRILIHDINDDRCTGCDACVAVCPTNVLDLVDNKSRVLNFADCIQCEACMWACPTEALVMHPEGTEPPKLKMPELDEYYQTAVPGQYLIGEVAGKPLVKNAANLGRGVVEHMLSTGLKAGGLSRSGSFAEGSDAANVTCVDVAIVGSGPGGLSAALTCVQRGLSYVVLEKDQVISSTIAHYPKGKLVMAEPYDVPNLSLLPVFDSSKEQLIPIWQELVKRVGLNIKLGEAVEGVDQRVDGSFDVRSNVASYRAQRVVLATGTRGKPRTLGVPGENLAKVASLLDDPDEFRGMPVAVIGGGDSACEAALALADAGAKVIMSYRGRSFARAQPKNKAALESYAAQRRIKVKFQSVVEEFGAETVTLVMADGTRKKYPNLAAFVLIGSDPPVRWLAKLGIEFVERPHQYQLSGSADMVKRFVRDAIPCPATAPQAAALVRGEAMPDAAAVLARSASEIEIDTNARPVSGPRKWIRSATGLFGNKEKTLERPMPLSEFAQRGRRRHDGRGRRDGLPARERTRVLRMLRDEGGRLADEDSRVYMIESKSEVVFDSPPPGFMVERKPGVSVPTSPLDAEDSTPKQAVIVGLARAMAEGPQQSVNPARRRRRSSNAPMNLPPDGPMARPPASPTGRPAGRPSAARPAAPAPRRARPAPPPPDMRRKRRSSGPVQAFDEPTRQVDPRTGLPPSMVDFGDDPTRAVDFDASQLMLQAEALEATEFLSPSDVIVSEDATGAIHIDTGSYDRLDGADLFDIIEDQRDESTFAVDVSNLAHLERMHARERRVSTGHEDATRSIKIDDAPRRVPSLSDVDWDLD